jgi:Tat protein translocase TatC
MPFLDHLEELRSRLLISLAAVVVGTIVGWLVLERVDLIAILKQPIAPHLADGRLVYTSPVEPFLLTLKFAFAIGLVLASPIVMWQAWAFLSPALYQREKRIILPALASGVVLFGLGAAAAYFWVLPQALKVLLGFQRADLAPFITANAYFSFALQLILAFGVITELPLLIVILASLGLVTPKFLAKNRRYALAVSAVLAAALTPPDVLSMLMMMVPLTLLYEISIGCAWIVTWRRAKRAAASIAALFVLLALSASGSLDAQQPVRPPQRPPPTPPPTGPAIPGARGLFPQQTPGQEPGDTTRQGMDTAAARRLGLPTAPTRTFPTPDSIIEALLARRGYRITRYAADSLTLLVDSQEIVLKKEVLLERDGSILEADSVRYVERACRLDATGEPRLFDQAQGSVMAGIRMRYDPCIHRGIVTEALTDYDQGGVTWYVRGNLAVDSDSSRIFGAQSNMTSDPDPMPSYHFAAGEMKWLDKKIMVARPAVLYVRDVPILWLPFIFQDIRRGRRSGFLMPQFGLNDLVRQSRGYERHIANMGYYFAFNDYLDLLLAGDWYAGRFLELGGQFRYRWLDRFVSGTVAYRRQRQLDANARSSQINWVHQQDFSSRSHLSADINYVTSATVLQQNSVDPRVSTAQISSRLNYGRTFDWGTFNLGGSRTQDLSTELVTQTFPSVSLTPTAFALGELITWTPSFSLTNTRQLHQPAGTLLAPGSGGGVDSVALFSDSRNTSINLGTPIRVGRWSLPFSVTVVDQRSNRRQEFVFPDSTDPSVVRRVVYASTFETGLNWTTGVNLPPLFSNTWRIQPGVSIANRTSGDYAIRNQFTGGEWVTQGKRLSFSLSSTPSFFGFFPGIGPLARIRHSLSPQLSYQYAPGVQVPDAYQRAKDPTGRQPNLRSDPQQTVSLSLSQNFEGKLRPEPGDTAADPAQARKIKLLSLSTTSISYNIEQAKQPGRTGWTTPTLGNTLTSDLVPGLSISLQHDLWRGPVGFDTTVFDPFLTSVTAQFSLNGGTLMRLLSLVGLGGRGGQPPPAPTPQARDTSDRLPTVGGPTGLGGIRKSQFPGPLMGMGVGAGFNMSMSYTSSRSRPVPGQPSSNTRQLNFNMGFSPSPKWQVTWSTDYNFESRQFGQHTLQLNRDLDRWQATFAFLKSPNGNFAFNFTIALRDQPDIKFDYDQRSLLR